MGHQDILMDSCMAIDAPNLSEMEALVRQPFMLGQHVGQLPFNQNGIVADITMTLEANGIVMGHDIDDPAPFPRRQPVCVRVVAAPAAEVFDVMIPVYANIEFFFNLFKIKSRKVFVTAMAINARILKFEFNADRMRMNLIIGRVAVSAGETAMGSPYIKVRIDPQFVVHFQGSNITRHGIGKSIPHS
jgi:hypothetical protein